MKPNKNTMIIGGMVLATIIAFLLINFLSGSKNTDTREVIKDLTSEISELESGILDLEVIMQDINKELDQKKDLLDEKYDMINVLTDKVDELERSGKVDKSTIANLRKQLQQAKNRVADASQIEEYKKEIDQLVADNAIITGSHDDITIELRRKDSLILALENQAMALTQQVVDCGNQQAVARAGQDDPDGNNSTDTPEEKEREPGFVAKDIVFWQNGVNKAVKVIKLKGLKEITVNFMLKGYKVPNGDKNIYLVFKNALTNKTFQSKQSKSGTFNYQGVATTYTALIKGNYQGSDLNISRPLIQDESARFEQGIYDAFIYHDGELLGKGRIGIQK